MVPPCCTAVVDSVVDVRDWIEPGLGIAVAGSYAAPNDVVLPVGTVLTDRAIAAAATVGRSRVRAHPRPRVVIITVGDHLVEVGEVVVDGLVHDATSVMLLAAARASGAVAFRGGPVRRDPAAIAIALEDQYVRADLIVILSGVDDTDDPTKDVVVQALRLLGEPEIEFCRIDPGTRIGLTTVGPEAVPLVTMDSDALCAFVGFEVMVRPMIAAMAGRQNGSTDVECAVVTSSLTSLSADTTFLPSRTEADPITGELRVEPMSESAHSASLWLYRADSIMIIPADVTSLAEGDEVAIVRLSES